MHLVRLGPVVRSASVVCTNLEDAAGQPALTQPISIGVNHQRPAEHTALPEQTAGARRGTVTPGVLRSPSGDGPGQVTVLPIC